MGVAAGMACDSSCGTARGDSLDLRSYMYSTGTEFLCENEASPQSISVIL
jgi:hypothetical protein